MCKRLSAGGAWSEAHPLLLYGQPRDTLSSAARAALDYVSQPELAAAADVMTIASADGCIPFRENVGLQISAQMVRALRPLDGRRRR